MGRVFGYVVALAAASILILNTNAFAYTPTVGQNGVQVRWSGDRRLNLAGNPSNRVGISENSFFNAVVHGLQRWSTASGGAVRFDYWQGADVQTYEPNSNYNGLSSIYFASNARGSTGLSPNVLGLTQVWYNTDTGEILEADIVLNDTSYQFTTNPSDTSGYGSAQGSSGRNVFVENVVTHELGHAYGLSHSGGLQSTMLFMESPEQAYLGCDEQVGIRAVYTGAGGAVRGTVVAEGSGSPVFGAHVLAISRRRGAVVASGITDRTGNYSIGALEPGSYFMMTEPFFAGPGALPAYYAGASSNVCGGQAFNRTLLMSGSVPAAVSVGSGASSVPTITARCSGGGAAISPMAGSSSLSSAPVIHQGSSGGFGAADRFSYSNTLYYRVNAVSGHVEVHALAYSLYSPVHAAIRLLDSSGRAVQATVADRVYSGNSGYVNYDSALVADGLSAGDYFVEVRASSLGASLYPAGPVSLDSAPYVVLTGSVNEGGPSDGALPFNGRCRMSENFPGYSSPAGGPRRSGEDEDDGGFFGFCGTVSGPSSGPGPGPAQIAGWFLPWIAMALLSRAHRFRMPGLRGAPLAATL